MNLDVVLLNWNSAADTDACLTRMETWQDLKPQVWIVDNGSHPDEAAWLRERRPEARLLASPVNLGFAGGNNLALTAIIQTKSRFALLLNTDATLPEEDAQRLLTLLEADATIGAAGPLLFDGEELVSAGGQDIGRATDAHLRPDALPAQAYPVDYVSGTAALLRVDALRAVGLFDEAYFFSGEMADLCRRMQAAGFRTVILPGARAQHDLSRSAGQRDRLHTYYSVRNRFYYVRKHDPRRQGRLFARLTMAFLVAAVAELGKGNLPRARSIWLGVVDGWRNRLGDQNERILG